MSIYDQLVRRYQRVTWFGMLLNSLFIFPLLFAPRFTLSILQLHVEPIIWARIPGLLLLWITIFYIPATIDLKKYRIYAWIAIFPSRTGGATFFFVAVFVFGYPLGFLPIAIVDLVILLIQLVILLKIRRLERSGWRMVESPAGPNRRLRAAAIIAIVLAAVGSGVGWFKLMRVVPQEFTSIEDQYKYGSIGTEQEAGIPYWLWLVLPRIFPEHLPGPGGYNSLGFATERGHALPVGFSKMTIGFERIGINCALCHVSSVRETADSERKVYPLGGSSTNDILGYQKFLFRCANDPRFDADTIIAEIDKVYDLSLLDRLLYRFLLVPATRKALVAQSKHWGWVDVRPEWGRGRIDPFNPIKNGILELDVGNTIGNSDMMPVWNMPAGPGSAYHWDGLNSELREVVVTSALGDGAVAGSLPFDWLEKLERYLVDSEAPDFPERFPIDRGLAAQGQQLFAARCADCHGPNGARTRTVIPLAEVGTDEHRVLMWTEEAAEAYNAYASDYSWGFKHFCGYGPNEESGCRRRSASGYVALQMDGIWIRGPYLHNGSVPTLRDLLEPPARRPTVFHRGVDVLDPVRVGFVTAGAEVERVGFRYDTSEPGNSNQGHLWGTDLLPEQKDALVEYLKTL